MVPVKRLIRMFIFIENGNPQITENTFFIGTARMVYITGLRRFLTRLLTVGNTLRLFL